MDTSFNWYFSFSLYLALIPVFSAYVTLRIQIRLRTFFDISPISICLSLLIRLALVSTSFIFIDSTCFLANLDILLFWASDVPIGVWRIAKGSFASMFSGSWIRITLLILLNSVMGMVSAVKAWSAEFNGNSSVLRISFF